jgi:hypothetical protein
MNLNLLLRSKSFMKIRVLNNFMKIRVLNNFRD